MRFAKITKQLMSKLPPWFAMSKDPESIGAQFLNITGLTLEDVEYALDYALKNTYIGSADLNQVGIVYKALVPNIDEDYIVRVYAGSILLEQAPSLEKFLSAPGGSHPFLLDRYNDVVYVRRQYNDVIRFIVQDTNGNVLLEEDIPLHLHHVWNFFDEFGLLLGVRRLFGESNIDLKRRILDVFRHPGGTHHTGLINSLARHLGLRKHVYWPDDSVDLVINDPLVILNTVELNGSLIRAYKDEEGNTIVPGQTDNPGTEQYVTYVRGVEIHEIHKLSHIELQNDTQTIDKDHGNVLQYYMDTISDRVPVMWDQFLWGEGFWDIASPEMSGYGCIPAFCDADISAWRNFRG